MSLATLTQTCINLQRTNMWLKRVLITVWFTWSHAESS